jgi:hypothetical protein
VSGGSLQLGSGEQRATLAAAGGLLVLGPLLMIVFRQKYPRWWFDSNRELMRFTSRVGVYVALMDDRFFVVVFAWFAILVTGRFPGGAFEYLVGVGRWHTRVIAYAAALVTDRYPPFRLSA